MEKKIPSVPARYSCLVIASIPKIKARGLKMNDKRKMPINPNIILKVP
jgi:hypothetical protein